MKKRIVYIVFAVLFQLSGVSISQIDTISIAREVGSFELELPSLNSAIEMALIKSPLIHNQKLVIERTKIKYGIDKKLIQRVLTFNSQYSYGNNSAVVNNQLMNVPYTSATASNFYSAGVFLNVSLFQLTARKKQLEMSRLAITIQEDQLLQIKTIIIQEVKQQYIELIKQRNILNLRIQAVASAKLAKEFVEIDFQSGTKSMEALSNANEAYTKLSIAREQSYAAYISTLYEFQTLIGKQ